jgi:hypothetical protein
VRCDAGEPRARRRLAFPSATPVREQPIVNPSFNPTVDTLNGPGLCNTSNGFQQGKAVPASPLNGNFGQPAWGRCGYGTRMPLLLVSPLAPRLSGMTC